MSDEPGELRVCDLCPNENDNPIASLYFDDDIKYVCTGCLRKAMIEHEA